MEASIKAPLADRKDGKPRDDTMPRQVHHETGYTGFVNPRWVEVIMGLPVGWTMPSCKVPVTPAQVLVSLDSDERWATPTTRDYKGAYSEENQRLKPRHLLPDQVKEAEALMWKTPRACEADGGVKQVREGGSTNYKLRNQVAHQGDLDYWPAPKPQKG
jgi:hypothetical protein